MKLILIGFGVVGQGFVEILLDKTDDLQQKQGFSAEIIGVITGSKGTLYHPLGLDKSALLDAAQSGSFESYPDSSDLKRNWDAIEIIATGNADAVIEMSPTNLETAEPALTYCHTALDNGKHLVLANKGPVALAYNDLDTKATENNLHIRYEATVMAGTPTMQLAEDALGGCTISEARGILNGTTNYILAQMENGMDYSDALAKAQELGYAETDPSGDVDGWDAAGKVLILSNALFGTHLTMSDLDVEGITQITADDINDAQTNNQRYKLIASVTPTGGSVQPVRLSINDPLASVGGATNAITLKTDLLGDVTLIGAGAGKLETGYAILADLLAIHRELC
jgi:homoserine dehydrogenase